MRDLRETASDLALASVRLHPPVFFATTRVIPDWSTTSPRLSIGLQNSAAARGGTRAREKPTAKLCASRHLEGDVLVHCAHGKGRSTCVLCACLVRAGLFATWRDAFDAVRPIDSRCLGPRMSRGHRAHRARTFRIGAYEHPGTQVRPRRKGVKLNAMMRDALDAWEAGHGQSWSDKAA